MSTRSRIAFANEDGTYTSTYHHFDGYPEGVGATLWDLYHGHFRKDVDAMRSVLIDQHPGGWSNINDCDFTLDPGFIEYTNKEAPQDRPRCYCHGDRHETDGFIAIFGNGLPYPDDWSEWAYLLDQHGIRICEVVGDGVLDEPRFIPWDGVWTVEEDAA